MVHVAKEMTREGFGVPLLIGGATTSKAHTAVKIAPSYEPGVVHVVDASRAVGVVGSLVSDTQRHDFINHVKDDYERVRQSHQDRGAKPLLSFVEACANRFRSNWVKIEIPTPTRVGIQSIPDQSLIELIP